MDRLSAIRLVCANELTLARFTKELFAPTSPLLRLFDDKTAKIAADVASAAKQLTQGIILENAPWFGLLTRVPDQPGVTTQQSEAKYALEGLLEALNLLATPGPVSDRAIRAEVYLQMALHRFDCVGRASTTKDFINYLLDWTVNDKSPILSA